MNQQTPPGPRRGVVPSGPTPVTELRDYIGSKIPIESIVGWCRLTALSASKGNGYVQVSVGGLNKVMTLQEALLILQGDGDQYPPVGSRQISHRCHQPRCATVGHVCVETTQENNLRKGCGGMMHCPCGGGILLLCEHVPTCIPNWRPAQANSFAEFFANANVCHHRKTEGFVVHTRPGRP